ncbi:PD-(D/E)XK nuclease family protein [Moorella naiadis]|uniref:RecB family exonuclease n=1 Tax=Moorella naiadis (nom. illeg.) TaxID=3093670 RepID=UPI003D9CB7D6
MPYSFSRLERFKTCPMSYFLHYVEKIPEPPSKPLEFGKACHIGIEAGLKGMDPAASIDQYATTKTKLLTPEDADEAKKLAERFLNSYTPRGKIYIEQELKGVIKGEDIIGYADLIEIDGNSMVITDFKSNWQKYSPVEKAQLPLYAWLASQQTGIKNVQIRLWFLRYVREPVVQVAATDDVMLQGVAWTAGKIEEIREAMSYPGNMGFEPKSGSQCKYCGYAVSCLDIMAPADIEELARTALRLERALELIKEPLKTYAAQYGYVQAGDQYYAHFPKSTWKFKNIQAFFNLLQEAGEDPWDYLEVSGFKLKKLLNGPLGDQIRAMGEERKSSYFSHHDKPPETN